jgi:hypothetical protein
MGWAHRTVVGDHVFWVIFSRSGRFDRHLDRGARLVDSFRVSGRHLRIVVQRRGGQQEPWDD